MNKRIKEASSHHHVSTFISYYHEASYRKIYILPFPCDVYPCFQSGVDFFFKKRGRKIITEAIILFSFFPCLPMMCSFLHWFFLRKCTLELACLSIHTTNWHPGLFSFWDLMPAAAYGNMLKLIIMLFWEKK